jgi:hypothetical protein
MTDPANYTGIPGQPPSLQDMIGWYDGWHNIPEWAWTEYHRAMNRWINNMRMGAFWYPPWRPRKP